jgi:glucose-6-phosphate isomerase
VATQAGIPDQIESVYKILRHLSANQRGVVLEGNLGEPDSLKVSLQKKHR